MNPNPAERLARRLFDEACNQRNLPACDDLFAPTFVEHAMAPFGIEAVVAGDTTVTCRVRATGTNLGKLNGFIPPTGKTFNSEQSHWYRVENGRFAEHWAVRDDLTSMIQLGALPGPRQPPA